MTVLKYLYSNIFYYNYIIIISIYLYRSLTDQL